MRKILSIIMLSVCCLSLCACNQNIGLGSYNFDKVHLVHQNKCMKIESWHDNENGVEVHLSDGSTLWCSEGTYILVSGKCPICEK